MKAQLRSRVFQAIEQNADSNTKKQVGFQWQNPNVAKIHESKENVLGAHLVLEYLEHFKMDYAKSVYLPEVALQHTDNFQQYYRGPTKEYNPEVLKKHFQTPLETRDQPVLVALAKKVEEQHERI